MQNETKPSTLEVAVALAETLQAMVPDQTKSKNGRPVGGIGAAAREIGVHVTKAQRAVRIAGIPDDVKRAAIEAGIANNQKALLAVAKEAAPAAKLAMVERMKSLPEPRADIPRSIIEAREAFLAGQKETYLGLTRAEWDRAADEHRWMVGSLLEAERQLTIEAKLRRAREFYAKAKLLRKFIPLPAMLPRRVIMAREAIVVLDLLQQYFGDDGENWCQNRFNDGHGRRCLVGGLRHIRSLRGTGDRAGIYLRMAIPKVCGRRMRITSYNNSRIAYGEIQELIRLARERARGDVALHARNLERERFRQRSGRT